MATVKFLTENKVPLVFPFQGVPISDQKTIFTSFTPYPNQSELVVTWLVKVKGFKRIGILYQDDKYGYTFRDPATETLAGFGLKLAAAESYKRGTTDLSAQVAKLRNANLDACLLVATPPPGAAFIKRLTNRVGQIPRSYLPDPSRMRNISTCQAVSAKGSGGCHFGLIRSIPMIRRSSNIGR